MSGYRLYLGGSQVGTSPSTRYVFSGLTCGTSCTLGVAVVDGAGNVSGTATISGATAACSASSQFSGTFVLEPDPGLSHCQRLFRGEHPGFSNVLFDHNRFDNIAGCTYEGRVTVLVASHPAVNLTISKSHFGGGGCSDGIQVIGNGATTISGLQIGPGNEFANIAQRSCDPVHADPIQFYHGNAVITGNYFHDNSTTVGSFDGDDNSTVSNNVFVYTGYPYSVAAWGADNWLVTHFVGGGELSFWNANSGETPLEISLATTPGPTAAASAAVAIRPPTI